MRQYSFADLEEPILSDAHLRRTGESQSILMIGHSRHPWEHFAGLLERHGVTLLVDVRTVPHSRFSPQFSQRSLVAQLRARGILYRHAPILGGKNPRPLAEQRAYIEQQLPLAAGACLMCSEGNFRECHRHYTLAPLFLALGFEVLQIQPDGSIYFDRGPTPETLRKMRDHLPPGL